MQELDNATFCELLDTLVAETHLLPAKKKMLQNIFRNYRTMQNNGPIKQWLDSLLTANQEFATRSGSTEQIRQHNIFIYAYIAPTITPYKTLAGAHYISRRQVDRDINVVMNRLLKFAFGVGGIPFV